MRSDCSSWCNVRGAGIGHKPTHNTLLPQLVDAVYWLKTPGESDGCTQTLPNSAHCIRYDGMCGSEDSVGSRDGEPRAPEAGDFFAPHFAELVCRARLSGEIEIADNDNRCSTVGAAAAAIDDVSPNLSSPPGPSVSLRPGQTQVASTVRSPDPNALAGVQDIYGSRAGAALAGADDVRGDDRICPKAAFADGYALITTKAILFMSAGVFVFWCLYPRLEPRLRRCMGPQHYTRWLNALEASYRLVVWIGSTVQQLRMAGVDSVSGTVAILSTEDAEMAEGTAALSSCSTCSASRQKHKRGLAPNKC